VGGKSSQTSPMGKKPRKDGDKALLEMDVDLAELYTSVERCKFPPNMERAMIGTHLSQLAGIWFDLLKDRGNFEGFTDEVLQPGTIVEYAAVDDDGKPQGNAIAILGRPLKTKVGLLFRGRHVLATDDEYDKWGRICDEEAGKNAYHFCSPGSRGCCKESRSGEVVIHLTTWRALGLAELDMTSKGFELKGLAKRLLKSAKALAKTELFIPRGRLTGAELPLSRKWASYMRDREPERGDLHRALVAAAGDRGVSSTSKAPEASEASDSEVEKPEEAKDKKAKTKLALPTAKRAKTEAPGPVLKSASGKKGKPPDSMPMVFESGSDGGDSGESGVDASLTKAAQEHAALVQHEGGGKSSPRVAKGKEEVGDALASRARAERKRASAARDVEHQSRKSGERSSRRGRRRRRDSESSDGSNSDGSEVFRSGSSRGASLKDLARKREGALLKSGLQSMERFLRSRDGADGDSGWMKQRAIAFLHQVVYVRYPPSVMGLRSARELEMQRFKAVQTSVREGNWQTARHQELIEDDGLLTTDREQDMTVRAELRAQKLRSQLDSVRHTGGSRTAVG
jgi:hypothetical protein